MCDIGERIKHLSRLQKREVQKVLKLRFFQRGLFHGFGAKLPFYLSFYFRQHRRGKCVLQYCRTKKRLSRPLKQEVQKVEK